MGVEIPPKSEQVMLVLAISECTLKHSSVYELSLMEQEKISSPFLLKKKKKNQNIRTEVYI